MSIRRWKQAILALCALTAPQHIQASASEPAVEVRGETKTTRWELGAFRVETIEWVRSGTPVMEMPDHTLESLLTWEHGGHKISVVDNGLWVSMKSVVRVGSTGGECHGNYEPLGPIGATPSNDAFWTWLTKNTAKIFVGCGLSKSDAAGFSALLAGARAEYPAAADFWKANSVKLFGTKRRRCTKLEIHYMPVPTQVCAKFSDNQ